MPRTLVLPSSELLPLALELLDAHHRGTLTTSQGSESTFLLD